jgi:hypothetical protein
MCWMEEASSVSKTSSESNKIVLHVWTWVEKKADMGKGWGRWLVGNGTVYIQHVTRLEWSLRQTMITTPSKGLFAFAFLRIFGYSIVSVSLYTTVHIFPCKFTVNHMKEISHLCLFLGLLAYTCNYCLYTLEGK